MLQNNGGDDLVVSANGSFVFATALPDGSSYSVTVLTHPVGQTCSIGNGSGTVSGADVTDVAVTCQDSGPPGTLDPTFGTGGIVVHDNAAGGNGEDTGHSVTTDASGRILVAGESWSGADDDMVIWRYDADGTLDPTFGADGIAVHHGAAGGSGDDYATSVTIDSSGTILATGASDGALGDWDMVIWRYDTDGTLDPTFGTGGIVVHDGAHGARSTGGGGSITIDSFGRILVAGSSSPAFALAYDMVIWCYESDGTLDPTFGTGGVVVHDNAAGGDNDDFGVSITMDSSGRVLLVGRSWNASVNLDMVVWRYNADGTLDPAFGAGGVVVQDGGGPDEGRSITTDSSGRILVAGYSFNGSDNDMALWRIVP